jgi:hypothetical protein
MSSGTSELEKRRQRRLTQKQRATPDEPDDSDWERGRERAMDGMNAPPAGIMMEMELARERDRELGGNSESVVNQSQFRNTQINEGYQWHKVKRQPGMDSGPPPVQHIKDMTAAGRELAAEKKRQKQLQNGGMKRKRVEIAPGIFAQWHEKDTDAKKKSHKKHKKKDNKRDNKKKDNKRKHNKKHKKKDKKDKKDKKTQKDDSGSGTGSGSSNSSSDSEN